jgi:hypothetical protein
MSTLAKPSDVPNGFVLERDARFDCLDRKGYGVNDLEWFLPSLPVILPLIKERTAQLALLGRSEQWQRDIAWAVVLFAKQNDAVNLRRLLDSGVSPSCGAPGAAVFFSCIAGAVDCLRLLLERGDSPRFVDGTFFGVPMVAAAMHDQVECMRVLVEFGGAVNEREPQSGLQGSCAPALLVAGRCSQWKAARWLVDQGADVDLADRDGWTFRRWMVQCCPDLEKEAEFGFEVPVRGAL